MSRRALPMQSGFGPVMQIAFVVRDLDAAIGYWTRVMNVGPFFLFEHVPYSEFSFRGKPSAVDMTAALAYSGETQIELIQQHNEAPSIYAEFLDSARTGVHHVAVMTDAVQDSIEHLSAEGWSLVQQGRAVQGAQFAYLERVGDPGGILELIERSPLTDEVFGRIREASRHWDGLTQIGQFA